MYATATAPTRRLSLLAAAWVGVLAACLFGVIVGLSPLPWFVDLALSVVVVAAAVGWWWATTPQRVLGDIGAEPIDERHHARYQNLVDALCLAFGVEAPQLHVIADDVPNAASLAGRRGAHLVCTTGLLEQLDRVSLEGVLAHELAHVRSGDAAAATSAVALVGYPLLGGVGPVGRAARPLGEALAPTRARLFVWCLGSGREVAADLDAVRVTRYPPGLYRGLRVIAGHPGQLRRGSAATAPLWIEDPRLEPAAPEDAEVVTLHPPLDQRIEVLGEL